MSSSLQIHLGFDGDTIDPDEITSFLGIRPSSTNRKKNEFQPSSWSLSTGWINGVAAFADSIDEFMETLYPHAGRFREISQRPGVSTCLCFWWRLAVEDDHGPRPAFHLKPEAIQFLAGMNASIDFDGHYGIE